MRIPDKPVLRPGMRFALVNGRSPRPDSYCLMCEARIGAGYLREVATQLIYCDQNCYANHCTSAGRGSLACVRAS
jgi:hypothetical protein